MTNRVTAAFLVVASGIIGFGPLGLGAWVWFIVSAAAVGTGLVGVAVWRGARFGARFGDDPASDRRWTRAIFATAILVRVLLIPADHYLSDDAFRYHWDGKVLSSGTNPYRYAPDDEAVAHLVGHELDALINHPDVVTVYPPYAELLFAAGYLLSPGRLWGFQALVLISEILAWLLLYREAIRLRVPRTNLLILAWLPLVIFESYLPGHTEALTFPFVALFIVSVSRGWAYRAGVALGFACLVKPVALLFVPAAIRELGFVRALRMAPGFAATILTLYFPFRSAGENLSSSMLLMARKWEFNGSLARVLEGLVPEPVYRPLLLGLLVLGVLVATVWGRDFISRALGAIVALVIVTPTLYPWYLLWAVPLLALRPQPALIALCGLAPLAHVGVISLYTNGVWDPPLWPSVVSYAVFYAVLAWGVWGRMRLAGSPG